MKPFLPKPEFKSAQEKTSLEIEKKNKLLGMSYRLHLNLNSQSRTVFNFSETVFTHSQSKAFISLFLFFGNKSNGNRAADNTGFFCKWARLSRASAMMSSLGNVT